jgi:hypothetical protein
MDLFLPGSKTGSKGDSGTSWQHLKGGGRTEIHLGRPQVQDPTIFCPASFQWPGRELWWRPAWQGRLTPPSFVFPIFGDFLGGLV